MSSGSPLPGSQTAYFFFLCLHRLGCSGALHEGTNLIPEGSSLMTQPLPKAPPPIPLCLLADFTDERGGSTCTQTTADGTGTVGATPVRTHQLARLHSHTILQTREGDWK